jgi:hypothetical protein
MSAFTRLKNSIVESWEDPASFDLLYTIKVTEPVGLLITEPTDEYLVQKLRELLRSQAEAPYHEIQELYETSRNNLYRYGRVNPDLELFLRRLTEIIYVPEESLRDYSLPKPIKRRS